MTATTYQMMQKNEWVNETYSALDWFFTFEKPLSMTRRWLLVITLSTGTAVLVGAAAIWATDPDLRESMRSFNYVLAFVVFVSVLMVEPWGLVCRKLAALFPTETRLVAMMASILHPGITVSLSAYVGWKLLAAVGTANNPTASEWLSLSFILTVAFSIATALAVGTIRHRHRNLCAANTFFSTHAVRSVG